MIFRLTQKLAKKIKVAPLDEIPLGQDPFADWSANVFLVHRTQFIIVSNTVSLYSAVFESKGLTTKEQFVGRAVTCLRELMTDDGFEFFFRRFVEPQLGTIAFSKSFNRSVTGLMSDFTRIAKLLIGDDGMASKETSFKLNGIPMAPYHYQNPREVFKMMQAE